MIRVIIPVAVVGCLVTLWLMQGETESPKQKSVQVSKAPAQTAPTPAERRIARDRVNSPKTAKVDSVKPTQPKAPTGEPEPNEEAPKAPEGPFTVDLGDHTIHLKDDARKRVVRFKLLLVTQTDTTRVEIRRRRRELVRMAYFLGSKRQADGAVGTAGKTRFERDLQERFQNVIRSGSIDSLTLDNYRIESRAIDAGVESD